MLSMVLRSCTRLSTSESCIREVGTVTTVWEAVTVPVLSPRQRDVLKSMTLGLTNKEIANQLGIRKDGVEDHINVIFQKLGASNRAEAVAIAMRKQLLKM